MRVQQKIAIAAGAAVLALGLLILAIAGGDSTRSIFAPGDRSGAARSTDALATRARERGSDASGVDGADTATSIVAGSLIDEETGPLAEGRVDLWCDDGNLGFRARVDDEGNFAGPACSGRTCARLVHSVFEQPDAWVLEPGVVRELTVVAAPKILGTVISASGEPIPDAKLLLRQGPRRAVARSDQAGAFALALPSGRPCDPCDVEAGPHCRAPEAHSTDRSAKLFVWTAGFASHEVEVTLDREDPMQLVLSPPAPPISGRVVGPDGTPVGLRTVVLAIHGERDAEQHAAEVDSDGSFSLGDLAPGRYHLRAIRDGHELAVLDSAAPGDRVELRVAQPLRGRDLEVEIRDDRDQPTPGAWVDGGPFRGAKTDARGRVEAREVLPGAYTLSVRVAGCPLVRTRVEIGAGHAVVHELVRLPTTCVISSPDG